MSTAAQNAKTADLAGPGIGDYSDIDRILPSDYHSLLTPRETQTAIYTVKRHIEEHLCKALNLSMVQVPLIVEAESGVNHMLDRDGSRTPIQFHISNDRDLHPVNAQVVQAATKWKRMALREFSMGRGEGLLTDMRAVRKDYFLDHDHSAYVDQWDWEQAIAPSDRTLEYLKETVRKIWKVLVGAERAVEKEYPQLRDPRYPSLPEEIHFLHAEELLDAYPDLPRKKRETAILQRSPPCSSSGSAGPSRMATLTRCGRPTTTTGHRDPFPHGRRCTDSTAIFSCGTRSQRRHELMSGGIRVNADMLRQQLAMSHQEEFLKYPYHQAIVRGEIPQSIGGGIGTVADPDAAPSQGASRRGKRLGLAQNPDQEICAKHNIHVLD